MFMGDIGESVVSAGASFMAGWQFKALVAIFVIAIGSGIVWTYNHSISRAIQAEQDLKESNDALESTRQSLQAMTNKRVELDKLLVEKQKDETRAKQEAQQFRTAFELLRKTNSSVNYWANADIPLPVIDLVQKSASVKPSH